MTIRTLAACLTTALLLGGCSSFDLQGHRGARGLAPENTLPAFERALALGVTTLELDVGVTRDGVMVIHHDPTLNPDTTRDSSGAWLAARGPALFSLSFGELQTYDVGRLKPGSKYGEPFAAQRPVDGTRIPRLSDLFALVQRSGDSRVRFNIETKLSPLEPTQTLGPEAFAKQLVATIRDAGMGARSTIQSFDWRTLQLVQAHAPDIATVYLSSPRTLADVEGKPSPWTAGFNAADFGGSAPRMVKAAGGKLWSPSAASLTLEEVRQAHALGLKVIVWTVNEPAQMVKLLDWGVDGIISDRPDLVIEVLKKRGIGWR
jgi:glycerophosphoryl diester phosphodiesterase